MKPISSKFSRPTTAKKPSIPDKVQKSMVKTTTETDAENITQLMQQLIINQKECEKSGKYVEAEAFKRKVKALQEQVQKRQLIQIRQRHEEERGEIEKAHLEELNCFNIQWSERIEEMRKSFGELEEELITRHEQQMRMAEEELNAQKPARFKQSAQLLNLKKIEQELAKQENYLEAHQVQLKAQKVEKQEVQKWKRDQSFKNRTNINTLRQKQQNELNALKQRFQLAFDERSLQRQQEEESIMLKYQNVLKELEFQQKQQIARYEKAVKLKNVQKKTKNILNSTSKLSLS